jgi:ferrous iron transport protein B
VTTFRLALVGAPNSGKSTLFNGLTGGRAKVANYAGVTVERRTGSFTTPTGREVELVDLPGTFTSHCNSRRSGVRWCSP